MPQEDPEHYHMTFKSYNLPDLSSSSLPYDAVDIKKAFESLEAEKFR